MPAVHKQSRPPRRQRPLTVSLHGIEGGYELRAECADETTSFTVLNPGTTLPRPDPANLSASPFARALAVEHFARCSKCRAWAESA